MTDGEVLYRWLFEGVTRVAPFLILNQQKLSPLLGSVTPLRSVPSPSRGLNTIGSFFIIKPCFKSYFEIVLLSPIKTIFTPSVSIVKLTHLKGWYHFFLLGGNICVRY